MELMINVGLYYIYFFLYFRINAYDSFAYCLCRRRKEEAGEPEADPERDQRTVFAYQVHFSVTFEFHFVTRKMLKPFLFETNVCEHNHSYL